MKVGRPGVSVRSRTGYWAPSSDAASRPRSGEGPAAADLTAAGLSASVGVPLRATVTPIAPAASGGAGAAEVAVVLTVREPALRAPEPETLTIVRNLYDARGTAGPPEQERRTVVLQPAGGTDEVHYDVRQTLTLTPGHHQIRFNVTSNRLKASGSVYADVEVPDFDRSPLSLSGLVLGPAREAAPADGAAPETAAVGGDAPASGLPVVPTTTRSFAPGDAISVFARIFQDRGTAPDAVTVTADVYDAGNAVRHLPARTFPATAFEGGRSAAFEAALPLAGLAHGPHLLSIAARLPGGRMARRDLVFWVR